MQPLDVGRLAGLPEEVLLSQLGEALTGHTGPERSGQEEGEMRQRAEAWLTRNNARLRQLLCTPAVLEAARGNEFIEMATVADLIAAHLLKAPGAVIASVIVCRRGLQVLCAESPPQDGR